MARYVRPATLREALSVLDGAPPGEVPWTVVAGGTDFYPARVGRAIREDVLDISALSELRGVRDEGAHHRIGALTRWSDLVRAPLPPQFPPYFRGLVLAAREIGGLQIQNAGTLGGNLCNASPAADGVPALLALDAEVELASNRGVRSMALAEFVVGNRATRREPHELLTAILVPKPRHPARSTFLKLGARRYLVISIAMVAAVVETAGATVTAARLAVGACSPVARRLPILEAALVGKPLAPDLADLVRPDHLDHLTPIDDVRGTEEYRRDAALTLVRRALAELAGDIP